MDGVPISLTLTHTHTPTPRYAWISLLQLVELQPAIFATEGNSGIHWACFQILIVLGFPVFTCRKTWSHTQWTSSIPPRWGCESPPRNYLSRGPLQLWKRVTLLVCFWKSKPFFNLVFYILVWAFLFKKKKTKNVSHPCLSTYCTCLHWHFTIVELLDIEEVLRRGHRGELEANGLAVVKGIRFELEFMLDIKSDMMWLSHKMIPCDLMHLWSVPRKHMAVGDKSGLEFRSKVWVGATHGHHFFIQRGKNFSLCV